MPLPSLGAALPVRGNWFSRGLGRAVLALLGWDFEGTVPDLSRAVLIVAPHTSNWDFVVGMATALALGLDAHWLGKHTLFRPPFGRLWRWLGGIPVDRSARHSVVTQTVAAFARHDRMLVAMAPEGTRKRVDRWKTGFYHIAHGAGVPILPVYLDFARRRVGVGPRLMPTGDLEAEVARLQAFFRAFRGKKPTRAA